MQDYSLRSEGAAGDQRPMRYQDVLPSGHIIGGEYSILRVLGTGGFATTYLARDLSLQREVAIKEYFPRDYAVRTRDTTVAVRSTHHVKDYLWGLRRFAQEAQIISKFRHPSVVRVYRILEANNTGYIVLEYVDGADMEVWLGRRQKAPSQIELDSLAGQIIDALGVVHSAGVLHRDIKPANIYIRSADLIPVLLDFGSSKFDFGDKTKTTSAIVSRGYSPQEAYASDVSLQGPWTDIYGFAATLYFAISGTVPPEAPQRTLRDDLVPASQLKVAGVRPGFLAAIDWGLRIQPDQRPRHVADWLPALLHDVAPAAMRSTASTPHATSWSGKPRPTMWSRFKPNRRQGELHVPERGPAAAALAGTRAPPSDGPLQPTPQPHAVLGSTTLSRSGGGPTPRRPDRSRPDGGSGGVADAAMAMPMALGHPAHTPSIRRPAISGRWIAIGTTIAVVAIAGFYWGGTLSHSAGAIWAAISPQAVQVDRGRGWDGAPSWDWFPSRGYGPSSAPSGERSPRLRDAESVPASRDAGSSSSSRSTSTSNRSPSHEDSGGRASKPARASSAGPNTPQPSSVLVPQ